MTEDARTTPSLILRCGEENCNLPWGMLQNGCLVIRSRHHGKTHVNVVPIERLLELAEELEVGEGWGRVS